MDLLERRHDDPTHLAESPSCAHRTTRALISFGHDARSWPISDRGGNVKTWRLIWYQQTP
jgi:hypothetical protein